jgi:hypothetical protein
MMTQAYDYSDSDTAPFDYELIPNGEIAVVQLRIRKGDVGEDGMLTRAKSGESEYLNAELVLLDGKYSKMKLWQNLLLTGATDGQKQMIDKSRAIMKAMLDSAYGLHPDDKSQEARAKRVKLLRDFEGLHFQVKIGIEKGKPKSPGSVEMYRDRNVLDDVITPNKPGYRGPFDQNAPSSGGGPSPATPAASAPVAKPVWAQ